MPGYEFTGWWGMVVPSRTPQPVIGKLNGELVRILGQAEVRDRLVAKAPNPRAPHRKRSPPYMRSEVAKWSKVIKTANIRID